MLSIAVEVTPVPVGTIPSMIIALDPAREFYDCTDGRSLIALLDAGSLIVPYSALAPEI